MLQSLTALPEKISGYDLANHLLSQGGVEALIRYAGNAETDWLELKAGMCLLPEDRKKGETEKDLYWNIAKEVIALMNTSGGALVIGIHDKTLNLVPLEENDPRHVLAEKGIDGYVREFVRSNVWPSSLSWTYRGKTWELADKQVPTDLISYHHAPYSGPDGRTGEVVVLLVKPSEKIRLAKEDRKSSVLLKRTRGEVGEAIPIYDYDEFDKYKASREVESAFYANVRDQFDKEHAAASESAKLDAAIQDYYSGLAVKARKMMAVFTPLDAEENVFSKDDVDQFYSPEAIETFDDEDRWLDDDDEEEDREDDEEEDEEDSDFDEDGDEGVLDSEDDTEDEEDARSARKGDLLELLKSEQRVIVSGEPGGGKTTCLTYFTLKFAERGNDAPILAVFIPMGQWRRGGSLSLMMERATGMDAGKLAHLMSENRLRLVIDAVNECPDDFRVAAIQNIGMFLAEHPTVPAVISTRHPKELAALHLPVFHVQPMDETHRLHYLERYLQNGEQAQKLLHQLGSMPGGETVAENPMLLRLVVEVYKESPEKRLPNGRAGLYRRSLRAWYKRENEKAEKAGTKLQWSRRQTFELLAVLAFKSRQRGYRDVPREEILAIWGADTENQLEVLCQGPIIYCDEEFVRFRHETFQEYLCAEYLVAHQDELPSWTQDDYAQWGMPFAYAVELFELDKQQLPESFWLAAWSLNPWLGVALTDERKGRQLLSPHYQGKRPMVDGRPLDIHLKAVYLRAICGTLTEISIRPALRDEVHSWYGHDDVTLRYVVFVSKVCQVRWEAFERRQMLCLRGLWIKQAVKLSRSWLILSEPRNIFRCHAQEDWNNWIARATPGIAMTLVNALIADPYDFSHVKSDWNIGMDCQTALQLMTKGIINDQDFRQKLPEWIEHVTVRDVAKMIDLGLEEEPLVRMKIQNWICTATPVMALKMVSIGLATKESFKDRKSEWIKNISISAAVSLARAGWVSKADFVKCSQDWIAYATPQMATDLVEVGLASPVDFSGRLSGWLQHPDYSFVRNYLKVSGELEGLKNNAELVRRWIVAASIESAKLLLSDGLITTEDFRGKIYEWVPFFKEKEYKKILPLLGEHEFAEFQRHIDYVHKVCCDWGNGLKSPPLVLSMKDELLKGVTLYSLKSLVKVGVVTKEEIGSVLKKWIDIVSPQMALRLIAANLVDVGDFFGRLQVWKSLLTPEVALELVNKNVIAESDVAEMRDVWINNVAESSLDCLRRLKCLSIDEAISIASVWEGTFERKNNAIHAVKNGVISIGDVVCGKIKRIEMFGAIITILEDVDGLLHVTDMNWGKYKRNPNEFLVIGQEIKVKVIDIDILKKRIFFGLKQLEQNPWDGELERFKVGVHMKGKIIRLVSAGVFVELALGMVGFVPLSECSWKREKLENLFKIGDKVDVLLIAVDKINQTITLSIRQTQRNPWDTMQERYPVGGRVKGKVRNFTAYGAFVELEEGIDGMIHIKDMSWTCKINHPSECLNIGEEVEAIVLNVDSEKQQVALSYKLTQQNPWDEISAKYTVGLSIKGRVSRVVKFGAFVELEPGIEGLIHISEISDKQVENAKDVFNVGDEVIARVVKVDPVTCRIGLSTKDAEEIIVTAPTPCVMYRKRDLVDSVHRQRIASELEGVHWEMKVCRRAKHGGRVLFSHPSFPDHVVFYPQNRKEHFSFGQKYCVVVCVEASRFLASSVEPLQSKSICEVRVGKRHNPMETPQLPLNGIEPVNNKGITNQIHMLEKLSWALTYDPESYLSIYLDETWPGTQDHAYEKIGVIGGIVVPWEGVDEKRLPVIKTHLDNGSAARKAIQTMLRRSTVFPFVFPIKWDHAVGAGGRQYFELVQHALMLLLGWMLPQRGQPTTVDVFLEHISGYMDGHDETDFINSLTQAMRLLSGGRRFANWQIRRVEWVDKEFGYVPYGDLVCKTCVPREEQQLLAREVKVREWEGFLPFSKDVFPLLRDMDTASPSGLADLLISFAKVADDTPFFRRVRKLAIDRAKADEAVCTALISRFEECYARPDRDMALLNRVVPHFLNEFPPDLFKERPRLQLLRILIGFQHANHNGDPDLATALVGRYHSLRPRILELDRDLCAYADLNLAVHHHDSFEFEKALSLVDGWINDPLFPALSVMNRGRMYSSRGQSLALLGQNQEADEAFVRALSIFSAEPELLASDIAQTKTYQAMNALDHDAPSAVPLVEGVLGKSLIATALNLTALLEKPFAAHLFLKTLWRMLEGRSVVLDALIKNLPVDIAFRKQHPYELILFHLALLTKEVNPSYAKACVREMEQFFETIEFGGTLGLIHAYMRVMLKRHGLNVATDKEFFGELDIVEQYLPKAGTMIDTLRAGWTNAAVLVEGLLPFNYC